MGAGDTLRREGLASGGYDGEESRDDRAATRVPHCFLPGGSCMPSAETGPTEVVVPVLCGKIGDGLGVSAQDEDGAAERSSVQGAKQG